jgi:hypothetical protein
MDPSLIFYHIQAAIRRVAEGEKHIAQQHEIIASLERIGLDAAPSVNASPLRGTTELAHCTP